MTRCTRWFRLWRRIWTETTRCPRERIFTDGACRSLFCSRLLGDFRNLRDKEDDYGIICIPPLEENTDVMVCVQNPCAIPVPSDCEDDERLGTLIEALAVDTCDNILDVYIHRSVIGKGLCDEQSAELLLILYSFYKAVFMGFDRSP